MGNYSDTKFVSIGFGFLAGYLYPCYSRFCDPETISEHIIAVTADAASLEEKRRQYPFPILLNDNETALNTMQPDIILFSPPPTVAPVLAKEVLKPYFDSLRRQNRPLPDLYAFPPSPQGKFYMDLLGRDINVCNILPNMTNQIAGQDLHGAEGNSYITMPDEASWPEAHRERLEKIFEPLGGIVYVGPKHTRDMLAALCVAEVLPLICFDMTDALNRGGVQAASTDIAEAMRALHQQAWGYEPEGSVPCSAARQPDALNRCLGRFCEAWTLGGMDYMRHVGMAEATAKKIMVSNVDLRLHIAQMEARDSIEETLRSHATKGGVAERGRLCYELLVSPKIQDRFSGPEALQDDAEFFEFCRAAAFEIAKIVAAHSRRMANEPVPVAFTPEHHAVLYALFVRNAKQMAGQAGGEAVHQGTLLYADQRGARMAKRALRDGEPLTPLSYMAYGEWTPEPGTMRAEYTAFEPEVIQQAYVCPWHTTWQRLGFLDEGKEYCSCIDYHLVKGFNREMELYVASNRPAGASCCEFVWKGFGMDDAAREALARKSAQLGNSCKMDWTYHTRHIYSAMCDALRSLPDGERITAQTMADFETLYGTEARNIIEDVHGMNFYDI